MDGEQLCVKSASVSNKKQIRKRRKGKKEEARLLRSAEIENSPKLNRLKSSRRVYLSSLLIQEEGQTLWCHKAGEMTILPYLLTRVNSEQFREGKLGNSVKRRGEKKDGLKMRGKRRSKRSLFFSFLPFDVHLVENEYRLG